jgi:hypothetical protein
MLAQLGAYTHSNAWVWTTNTLTMRCTTRSDSSNSRIVITDSRRWSTRHEHSTAAHPAGRDHDGPKAMEG